MYRGREREPRMILTKDFCDSVRHLVDIDQLNSVEGLVDLLESVGRQKVIIEVGCSRGVSTVALAEYADEVYAIDPWPDEEVYKEFCERTKPLGNVTALRDSSPAAASAFVDGFADLIYIDADHRLGPVKEDIRAWRQKTKRYLAGHDFVSYEGHYMSAYVQVIEAVRSELGEPDKVFSDTSWLKEVCSQ